MLNGPSRVDTMVEDGYSLLAEDDAPSALMIVQMVVKLDPNHPDAWGLLGAAHFQMHNFDDALRAYTTAIECDRRVAAFYFGRGRVHFDRGRVDEAAEDFKRADKIQPGTSHFLGSLAQCAMDSGNLELAADYLERCLELDPHDTAYRDALAGVYLGLATEYWTPIETGEKVATSYDNVTTARYYLKKAEQLEVASVEDDLGRLRKAIVESERRRFYAIRKPGILAIVLGLFLFPFATVLGYLLLGGGILYFFALRPPQYDLNRRALNPDQLTRFDESMYRLYYHNEQSNMVLSAMQSAGAGIGVNIAFRIASGIFRVVTVPVMATWALLENYDVADYTRLEAGRLKTFVSERLLDDPLLKRFKRRSPR